MSFLKEYTMLQELGKGGFATVYKVRHNELGYIRAIRVLNNTITDERCETYRKFLEECKLLLRLGNGTHPNIIHIYQPRLLHHKALVEMDFVDGSDLTHYIAEKRFIPAEEVLRFVSEISNALAYCHEDIYHFCMDPDPDADNLQSDPNDGLKVLMDETTRKRLIQKYKIVHNDIHSGNVIRKYDGSFVLLDFGLAIEGDNIVRSSRRRGGAPEYKSPEKWNDEWILSEQSDIYSFGILLYEMLAGRVPFIFDKNLPNQLEAELMVSKAHQDPDILPPAIEPLRRAAFEAVHPGETYEKDYPDWLEQVVWKCLEKNPENRFVSGKELFLEVEKNLKEINLSKSTALRRLTEANEDLTRVLGRIAKDHEELKQVNTDLTGTVGKLSGDNEKLGQELKKTKSGIVVRKILTGIAAMLTIFMIFAYVKKSMDLIEPVDTSGYETTIAEQKTTIADLQSENATMRKNLETTIPLQKSEIENLQNENATLQKDLKAAESKSNNSALIEQKNKEINALKSEKKNLQATVDNVNKEITTSKKEIATLTSDKKTLQTALDNAKAENTKLKNQPPRTEIKEVVKEVVKDNPAQAEKIKNLEYRIRLLTDSVSLWKGRAFK